MVAQSRHCALSRPGVSSSVGAIQGFIWGISVVANSIEAVVFDLGGVLVDWDPRYLYRKLFDGEAAMERFLGEVCSQAWNEGQDAGRPVSEATATLVAEHPDKAELIRAYYDRWPEMLAGSHPRTVAVLADLKKAGVPLFSLRVGFESHAARANLRTRSMTEAA